MGLLISDVDTPKIIVNQQAQSVKNTKPLFAQLLEKKKVAKHK
ncbi:hypothetical protein [Microscilla marina]|uniref:Uncharacterized protein n=1 Tax=Microscilla marina ATCC 23134 TaxID=313606 RepID=A1ZV56_MICM2|nr:hypothetical protein [Microscilla marina]EAY25712.1 hypothetical protein M23134_04886 [Microscilla marina ATCC 23134]